MIYQRPDELYHFGIKGMRWGVRRYQNKDGSLTSAGQRHRDQLEGGGRMTLSGRLHARSARKIQRDADNLRKAGYTKEADAVQGVANKQRSKIKYRSAKSSRLKKALGLTLGTAAAAAAGYYGGKKLGKYLVDKNYGKNAKFTNIARKFSNAVDTNAKKIKEKAHDFDQRLARKYPEGSRGRNNLLRVRTGMDKALGAAARTKQKFYESGGSVPNMIRRQYTTSGGARGIVSGVTGRAKSAARYYGDKVSNSRLGQTASRAASRAASGLGRGIERTGRAAVSTGSRLRSEVAARGGLGNIAKRTAGRAASGLGRGIERTGRAAVSTGSRLRSEVAARGGVSGIARSAYNRRKRRRQANRATLYRF